MTSEVGQRIKKKKDDLIHDFWIQLPSGIRRQGDSKLFEIFHSGKRPQTHPTGF